IWRYDAGITKLLQALLHRSLDFGFRRMGMETAITRARQILDLGAGYKEFGNLWEEFRRMIVAEENFLVAVIKNQRRRHDLDRILEQGLCSLSFFFTFLQLGDVDADADDSAFRGTTLDNLCPAAILVGADNVGVTGTVLLHPVGDPRLEIVADALDVCGSMLAQQVLVLGAGDQQVRCGGKVALCRAVAEHDAIVAI